MGWVVLAVIVVVVGWLLLKRRYMSPRFYWKRASWRMDMVDKKVAEIDRRVASGVATDRDLLEAAKQFRQLAADNLKEAVPHPELKSHKELYAYLMTWYARKIEDVVHNDGRGGEALDQELELRNSGIQAQRIAVEAGLVEMAAGFGISVDELKKNLGVQDS